MVEEVNNYEQRSRRYDHVHDSYLRRFFIYGWGTAQFEELLPSFQLLSPFYQQLYYKQLDNTFNLAAWIQGESVPFSLYQFCTSWPSCFEQRPRLVVQIVAFSTFNYDSETFKSKFDDEPFKFYLIAAKGLLAEFPKEAPVQKQYQYCIDNYHHYLMERTKDIAEIRSNIDEQFALFRIVALSRTVQIEDWKLIENVWEKLRNIPVKEDLSMFVAPTLTRYLNQSGFTSDTAIYIVFSPAILQNSINQCKSLEKGLFYGLQMLAKIYVDTTEQLQNGSIQPEGKLIDVGGIYMKHARDEAEVMSTFQEAEDLRFTDFLSIEG